MTSSVLHPSVFPSRLSESERPDLKPPRQGRWGGPVGLALVVHALLILALTWGVSWKRDATPAVFEAELWSALPKAAAPRAIEPPPSPAPAPRPVPKPAPKPAPKPEPPAPKPTPPPPAPSPTQADIATEQAKKEAEAKRLEQVRQEATRKAAAEKAAVQKANAEKAIAEKVAADKAAASKAVADKAAVEKAAADKVALEKKRQAEKLQTEKIATEKKAAELKAEKAQEAQERLEAAAAEKDRVENVRRMLGQAGASGGSGSAQKDSGPSPGYNARLVARIKPNVVFTDAISGNPVAEIEVRTQPDGTIISRRLVKSSGNPAWDDAALRAIDRTGSLPRDTDGRVPSPMIVVLRPQD